MKAESQRAEATRIADQLRRSYEGNAWHGPSLKEVLDGVTAEIAARRPAAGSHSIWELVRHIAFWASVVRKTLEGHPYPPRLMPPADWPKAEEAWPDALAELDREERRVIELISQFPDERLEEIAAGKKGFTFYILLHGLIQHNIYHGGQIALVKNN